ncbi:MAG: Ig-like domain-containing protein, partial [Eubacteriales bacterium]|nr:Ig-like domain-containing protein [Eubacteriales bacterium]
MKKNLLFKAAAVLTMLALALVITVVPGTALAAISGVTITPGVGQSYTIPVGGTVDLTATLTGSADGAVTYTWAAPTGGSNISFSATDLATTTVTGVTPGTSATVQVTAAEAGGGSYPSTAITINVTAMTISDTAITLEGGSSKTLTVGNVATSSSTVWSTSDNAVASVDAASGLVTAVGAGNAT